MRTDGALAERTRTLQSPLVNSVNIPNAEQAIDAAIRLGRGGRLVEAEAMLRQVIAAHPGNARALSNLSVALFAQQKYEESLAAADKSLAIHADAAFAHQSRAKTLHKLGRIDEAIQACRRALELTPNDPELHGLHARVLLLAGDFKRGWREYEWRWKCESFKEPRRKFAQPMWSGGKVADKTVLLHSEQGFGDTIQFVRYVPLLAERGANVILEVPRELNALLARMPDAELVISAGDPMPTFDLHVPMMSLPMAFGTTLKTVPNNVPYISPNPRLVEAWGQRVKGEGGRLKVGLAWAGRKEHADDAQRTIRLERLAPLARPDVTFFSLQKWDPNHEAASPPAGMRLVDLGPRLGDFADSAAVIANLDLVICVDTAVAHLAGAMGKSVWMLLSAAPDYRWLLEQSDSPWYPTMRLFRQPKLGDWETVLKRVGEELGSVR